MWGLCRDYVRICKDYVGICGDYVGIDSYTLIWDYMGNM